MKLVVSWVPARAGSALAWLVGMLTLGTALPHGTRWLGGLAAWQDTLSASSVLALVAAGLVLWLGYGIGGMPPTQWMLWKLLAVVLAVGYHYLCARHLRFFESGAASHSHIWYRWFNEAPVLLLVAAVVLVVVKPF